MRLVRSWPDPQPEGRNYVVDDAERVYNTGHDYRPLIALGDDVIHLDWDQAVDREHLVEFVRHVRQEPDRVMVVPCRLREVATAGERWNVVRYEAGEQATRYMSPGEDGAHLFGFGMVYLPAKVLQAFEDEWADRMDAGTVKFTDTGFAGWHYRRFGEARVDWSVRCVHVHYRISEVVR
jgi:hypothetical protein